MEKVAVDVHSQAKEATTITPKSQGSEETVVRSPDEEQNPPPPPGAGGGEEGVDIISSLPDAILGEIIFLLPTKEAARTQALSSRWRHVWSSSPLNIDHAGLSYNNGDALAAIITRIIGEHQGPVRRISVPERCLYHQTTAVKAWLRSPALDNLLELEFYSPPLPRFRYTKSNSLPRLRRQLFGPPKPPHRQ